MTSWTYLAQRIRSGEFIDVDLPIARDELSFALSGAGALRGTVTPDVGRLRAPDGRLLLEEWGTAIYAEADGEIRWGGILVRSGWNGEAWELEAASFATYPHGLHYDNAKSWTQVDPVEPFKELWLNAQWRPNARLGVQVYAPPTSVKIGYRGTAGDNSAISVGDISSEKWVELKRDGWAEREDGKLYPPARVTRQQLGDAAFELRITEDSWRAEEKPDGAGSDWKPSYADPPLAEIDAEPYALSWWESPDIGGKLDDLASTTPFDYTERHFWAPDTPFVDVGPGQMDPDLVEWLLAHGWFGRPDDGLERLYRPDYVNLDDPVLAPGLGDYLLTRGWYGKAGDGAERLYRPDVEPEEIGHIVRVHYPRAGTRRNDLVFIQGDNISEIVTPEADGDEYANSVTGIGAGEGALALRTEVAVDDGRLYRAALWTDKSVDSSGILTAKATDELTRRRNLLQITEVTVRDHPNAPIGSWQLGDDVLIQADLPHLGFVELWCRVVGWSLVTDDTARLSLERSDSFRYGG